MHSAIVSRLNLNNIPFKAFDLQLKNLCDSKNGICRVDIYSVRQENEDDNFRKGSLTQQFHNTRV